MDPSAEEDCRTVVKTLERSHIPAMLLSDRDRGVPEGVWEVQVGSGDAARAERIIATNPPEVNEINPSHELDLVTVYESGTPITGKIEMMGIKALLEANGIMSISNGDSVQPELPFSLNVAREQAAEAKRLIAEARANAEAEPPEEESQGTE